MPAVEKVSGGRVYIRPLDRRFTIGDCVDVDGEMAAYLTEERGDFETVDNLRGTERLTRDEWEDEADKLELADLDEDSPVDTLDAASDDSTTGDAEAREDLPDDETDPESEVSADSDEPENDDDGDGSLFEGEDFSSNGWLDNSYQDRADAVRAGGLDDYLDQIESVETSDTVIDAVQDRRSELED